MEAIQALRAKAKAAGNLKTTSQITLVQQSPSTTVIQPSNPQVIYVPEYNSTLSVIPWNSLRGATQYRWRFGIGEALKAY